MPLFMYILYFSYLRRHPLRKRCLIYVPYLEDTCSGPPKFATFYFGEIILQWSLYVSKCFVKCKAQ